MIHAVELIFRMSLVAPVFAVARSARRSGPIFYVANRAHHADIGGSTPGSMGAATEIYQGRLEVPPLHLARNGVTDRELLGLFLANVRGRKEREETWPLSLGL